MTGITHSNLLRLGVAALLATACPTRADKLSLEGDAHLIGNVTDISENGSVHLQTPLCAEPIILRPGSVQKIIFAEPTAAPSSGTTRVKLTNGDVLPCELKNMDREALSVATSFSSDLKIPRTTLDSLELGILSEKVIFENPSNLDGWKTSTWHFKDNAFSSSANGALSHPFELPDQYIIRFRLNWQNMPNLRFSFADPLEATAKPIDRYFMTFNNAGFALKRQSSTGRTYVDFITLNRRPDAFPNSRMDIEIRVDRSQSMIWLYIDGTLEGRVNDLSPAPKSGGISFESNTGTEAEHRISQFRILSWDATGDRHRSEDRGDLKTDALIDSEGDRYSGQLESISSATGSDTTLNFKSPLIETPLSIPAKKVSTVFFAQGPKPATPASPLLLKLRDGGSLQIESCTFSAENVRFRHPILGPLSLNRAAILSIEQAGKPSEPTTQE